MIYANAKWLNIERTKLAVDWNEHRITINAIPGLVHYDGVVSAGIPIADPDPVIVQEASNDEVAALQAQVAALNAALTELRAAAVAIDQRIDTIQLTTVAA